MLSVDYDKLTNADMRISAPPDQFDDYLTALSDIVCYRRFNRQNGALLSSAISTVARYDRANIVADPGADYNPHPGMAPSVEEYMGAFGWVMKQY